MMLGFSEIAARSAKRSSVRIHGKANLGANPRAKAIADVLDAIKVRRAS
jgi:hypothetical protein